MRLPRLLIAALATLAAMPLSACATETPAPLAPHYRGSPVPATATAPVNPEPAVVGIPSFSPPSVHVGVEMENALSSQIGRDVPMTPHCGQALKVRSRPRVLRCYARWDGVAIPFRVTLTKDGPHGYDALAIQLEGLLVASAVRTAWAQFNYATDNRISCASDMPQASLVPFGKPARYLCYTGTSFYSVKITHIPNNGVTSSPFVFRPI